MGHGAREAIESRHNDDIKPAAPSRITHHSIECGTCLLGTADSFVAVLLCNHKPATGGVVAEGHSLSLRCLAVSFGRDPHIECCALHLAPPCDGRSMPAFRILSAAAKIRCALRSGIVAPSS